MDCARQNVDGLALLDGPVISEDAAPQGVDPLAVGMARRTDIADILAGVKQLC